MHPISFKRHRFPGAVICQAVRLYFRFTLSIRDVEELMAERGIVVSREAIRCWVIKFGPLIAAKLLAGDHRQRAAGIWTKWWSGSAGDGCIYGGPSMTRVRFWTSWSRSGATSMRR